MINIDVDTYEELEIWLRTEKKLMYTEMVNEIELCWRNELDLAKIARAELYDGATVIINLPDDEWLFTLDKCLEYFEEEEHYETCTRILKIKEEIHAR